MDCIGIADTPDGRRGLDVRCPNQAVSGSAYCSACRSRKCSGRGRICDNDAESGALLCAKCQADVPDDRNVPSLGGHVDSSVGHTHDLTIRTLDGQDVAVFVHGCPGCVARDESEARPVPDPICGSLPGCHGIARVALWTPLPQRKNTVPAGELALLQCLTALAEIDHDASAARVIETLAAFYRVKL